MNDSSVIYDNDDDDNVDGDRLSRSQSQSTVKSQNSHLQWIIVSVICILLLAWRLAIVFFHRLRRVYRFVELSLCHWQVPSDRASVLAGVIVICLIVTGATAICGVGLYWWHKLAARVVA